MKIHLEVDLAEVAIITEAVDAYDDMLAFVERGVASTPEEKLEAARKRGTIRQMRYLKDAVKDLVKASDIVEAAASRGPATSSERIHGKSPLD